MRTITALALSALAEASNPYGIEAFDSVLVPLMDGIAIYRGKALAAFLKAIGFVIPLMESEHAGEFTQFLSPILIREFTTNDDEMKKIVLKVVKQTISTEGVKTSFVRDEIIPPFFANFWVRRNALDRKNYRQLIETTSEIAFKVGGAEIIKILEPELKDESEAYRKILMETVEKIVTKQGVADINASLEQNLMDGCLYAF